MGDGSRAKKVVGGIYSLAAKNLYDPIVVKGAFKLFGGRLNDLVLEQGREAVAAAKGRPILDMPVGTGYFTLQMARLHEGLVVGADIARGMVKRALEDARSQGIPNVAAIQADAHRLPFPDETFGAVLCTNGLQVIPGLMPTAHELVRVLAPGGSLYVSVVNAPFGAVLPETSREHLPSLLRPKHDFATAFERAGMASMNMRYERLAALYSGTKPGG